MFPSQVWQPFAPSSYAPSVWTLVHPAYGVVMASMDVNGHQVTSNYDDLGRPLTVWPDDAATQTFSYQGRDDSYGGQNGLVVTAQVDQSKTIRSTDAAGRTIQTTHTGFNGVLIDTDVSYDLLGRAVSVSRPYDAGSAVGAKTQISYDGLGRILKAVWPDQTTTTHQYTQFTATTTDPSNKMTMVTRDVDARTIASSQWLPTAVGGGPIWVNTVYHYAPFSQLDTVTDPQNNGVSTLYDPLGRPVTQTDPDAGTIRLQYDGFDDLVQKTHAPVGQMAPDEATRYGYDGLGRQTTQSVVDGSVGVPQVTTLTWDSVAHGIGALATAVSPDQVQTAYQYDSYGRANGMTETIAGQTYTLGWTFDSQGRVNQQTYPTGLRSGPGLTLQTCYDAFEEVTEVDYQLTPTPNEPALCAPSQVGWQRLWKVDERNADDALLKGELGQSTANAAQGVAILQNTYLATTGQLQRRWATAQAGNTPVLDLSYAYYPDGQVQTRTDAVNARAETFSYDGLNRLTDWNLSYTCLTGVCPSHPTVVNATNYQYDTTGNLQQVTLNGQVVESNSYGGANGGSALGATGGPHALTTHQTGSTSTAYHYDSHGRQDQQIGGRTLTYTPLDLPKTVTLAATSGSGTGGATWTLQYDAFGNRAQKSGPDGTTVYVGGVYQLRTTSAGQDHVYQVPGLAQIDESQGNGTTVNYLLTDALGSTGTVLDGTGKQVNTFFYDPFGVRTNADSSAFTSPVGQVTDGFTGQEHDDDWGLINFKGRIYDPHLKRMLSTDPHVTFPLAGQNWNPYSYVMNNPVNFIDPSGLDDEGAFDDADSGNHTPAGPVVGPNDDSCSQLGACYPNTPATGDFASPPTQSPLQSANIAGEGNSYIPDGSLQQLDRNGSYSPDTVGNSGNYLGAVPEPAACKREGALNAAACAAAKAGPQPEFPTLAAAPVVAASEGLLVRALRSSGTSLEAAENAALDATNGHPSLASQIVAAVKSRLKDLATSKAEAIATEKAAAAAAAAAKATAIATAKSTLSKLLFDTGLNEGTVVVESGVTRIEGALNRARVTVTTAAGIVKAAAAINEVAGEEVYRWSFNSSYMTWVITNLKTGAWTSIGIIPP